MKRQLFSIVLITLATMSTSQAQIVNAGFENWTSVGTCSDPDGWNSANAAIQSIAPCAVVEETTTVHGGLSAVRVVSAAVPGFGTLPGAVTNGTVNLASQSIEGGQNFSERPTSFTGWYTYSPQNTDECAFRAFLIKEGANPSLDDTVGTAGWSSGIESSSFMMFDAPVTYTSSDAPTMLQIVLTSSDLNAQVGSEAIFDDLDYETLSVGIDESDSHLIKTYPNPVIEDVFFNLGNLETGIVNVFNVLGEQVLQQSLTRTKNRISMANLPTGTYIWQMSTTDGEPIKTGKLTLTK